MIQLPDKRILVLGADASGRAALALLHARGADAVLVDALAAVAPAGPAPDAIVVSAGCAGVPPLARAFAERDVPVIGERELAFQESLCLHVAVTGGSGKSTTADLIQRMLRAGGRRVEVALGIERPACSLVEASRELDFMVHAVAPAEVGFFQQFRPVVGVLLNSPPDHPGHGGSRDDLARAMARLFARQQAFDWAIVQSEALAHLQAIDSAPPGKVITFSASSRQADLAVDRGLLVSRAEGWVGPLWDMARGRMRGPHFAEDALAALAVGRVLKLGLDEMIPVLEEFRPGPRRMEALGEAGGVRFVHDGRAANLDALAKALTTLAPTPPADPFIWLVAGGESGGRQFYDAGPLISPRVKHAFLFGEAAASMRAAWQLFTPCSLAASLLDAANSAAEQAVEGDCILFSPACPSSGSGPTPRHGDDAFREVFEARLKRVSEAGEISGALTDAAEIPRPIVRSDEGGEVSAAPPPIRRIT